MNHTGAMSGVGQETRPFGAFRNVHEVDTATLRCVPAALCLHAFPVSVHGLQTYFLQQQYSTHLFSTGSSSLYTHIPNFTSWRSPLVWWQWQERKAVGKDVFWRGGAYCTSFPWAPQQRPLRASWDEWTRRATSVQNVQGPKISRWPITTCPETEGEMVYCSPLLLPPLLYPPLLVKQINSKSC